MLEIAVELREELRVTAIEFVRLAELFNRAHQCFGYELSTVGPEMTVLVRIPPFDPRVSR
jgi:hypothetical protein